MDLRTYIENETTQEAFATGLGVTQGAVSQWLRKGVPPKRVLAVEKATGGLVTRYELRPDIYPDEPQPKPKPARKPKPNRH